MAWTAPASPGTTFLVTSAFWLQQIRDNLLVLKTSIDDNGHLRLPVVQSESGTYTALVTDDVILCTSTWTLALPAVASATKRFLQVKNVGTGVITIDANSTETIDGALTQSLTVQYQSFTLYCDGSAWYIL